jgi:hypothetical protein
VPAEVPAGPSSHDARPVNRRDVDGPAGDQGHVDASGRWPLARTAFESQSGPQNALEGTVLRVPCIPASRARGFWRSSVRGHGPPAPSHSCGRDGRRLRHGSNRAGRLLAQPSFLEPDLFALRVARPSVRTRCRSATTWPAVYGCERAGPCNAAVTGTLAWSGLAVMSLDIIASIKSAQLVTSQPRFGTSSNVPNVL